MFSNCKKYVYYYVGNHRIYEIVKQGFYELRIDMGDFNNVRKYALYRRFSIADERSGYVLSAADYEGDAGKCFSVSNQILIGRKFILINKRSTKYQ
jgi:hypothetical protein